MIDLLAQDSVDNLDYFNEVDPFALFAIEHERPFNAETEPPARLLVGNGVIVHIGDYCEDFRRQVGLNDW